MVRGRRNPLHFGLPERLKKARKAAMLTRQGLSLRAGLSNTAVRIIEEDARTPALDTVELLARALGCAPCWLAYGQLGGRTFGSGRFPVAVQGIDAPRTAVIGPADPLSCAKAGERLVLARSARGLSRNALGKLADLSHTAVGNIEEGRSLPSIANAEQLAGALEVSPCWLAYGEGEGPQ